MEIKFRLKEPKSKKETLIYCYYKRKIKLSTGLKILPGNWDKKKQKHISDKDFNQVLKNFAEKVEKAYFEIKSKDGDIANIKTVMDGSAHESVSVVMQKWIDTATKAPSTLLKYGQIKRHVERYEELKRRTLSFNDFNAEFYDGFFRMLVDEGNINNSIGKAFANLKAFLNWALERGYHNNTTFQKWTIIKEQIEIIFLTDKELRQLYEYPFTGHLERHRDVFLLLCYTGLRYSDIEQLQPGHVTGDFIIKATQKTGKRVKIPLLPIPKEILNKYFKDGGSLPITTNQKENFYIKECCKLAEINTLTEKVRHSGGETIRKLVPKYKLITMHSGRKTFITLSKSKGMDDDSIMNITAITDSRTLRSYKHVSDEYAANKMLDAWKKE